MSQENTYRPAVLPSEAVMMPAVEEPRETPLPAAQQEEEQLTTLEEAAMVPAQNRVGSGSRQAVERIRDRMRGLQMEDAKWVSVAQKPLDATASAPAYTAEEQRSVKSTSLLAQGTALSTLMRSATRQHTPPAPMLTAPVMRQSSQAHSPQQMRNALRQVVRDAQQPQLPPSAAEKND